MDTVKASKTSSMFDAPKSEKRHQLKPDKSNSRDSDKHPVRMLQGSIAIQRKLSKLPIQAPHTFYIAWEKLC